MTDLLVIGGGAAGLMAAGAACARGLTVTVLEHNPKGPGQKLLITGKGRCNVTSDSDVREFLPYVRHNGRFCIRAFTLSRRRRPWSCSSRSACRSKPSAGGGFSPE